MSKAFPTKEEMKNKLAKHAKETAEKQLDIFIAICYMNIREAMIRGKTNVSITCGKFTGYLIATELAFRAAKILKEANFRVNITTRLIGNGDTEVTLNIDLAD